MEPNLRPQSRQAGQVISPHFNFSGLSVSLLTISALDEALIFICDLLIMFLFAYCLYVDPRDEMAGYEEGTKRLSAGSSIVVQCKVQINGIYKVMWWR